MSTAQIGLSAPLSGTAGLPGQRALTSGLVGQVHQVLSSDLPDVLKLVGDLEADLHLTREEAVSLLYRVVLRLNLALFPPVTKLELIHTEGCNLACTYCFEREMLGYRRMPLEIAKAGVDLLFDYSGDRPDVSITHFGGEPTLNFSAIQAVTEYAEEKAGLLGKSVHFDMTSNGTLMNEGMARYCADHKIMVLLSVDGLEATHDRFRVDKKGRGSFERAMKGLSVLKQFQPWVGVKVTVMPQNVSSLCDDVKGLYQVGVNQFLIGHATGVQWCADDLAIFSDQFERLYRWYKESPRTDLRIKDFDDLETMEPQYFGCQAGKDNITVHITGEVSPCAKILALDNKQLLAKLGDVWHGLTHLRNRSELVHCDQLRAACDRKQIAADFQGGCWAENFEDNDDLNEPSLQGYQFSILRRSACSGCNSSGKPNR